MMKKKKNLIFGCIVLVIALFCGCTGEDGRRLEIGSPENGAEGLAMSDDGNVGTADSETDSSVRENAGEKAENGDYAEGTKTIRVYVCGAVNQPGVVEIDATGRVEDALEAAGGFAPNASKSSVNLADWVTDGQMIYFPTEEEAEEGRQQEKSAAAGRVNINLADVEELCTLSGIGESRALEIIAYREKNGPFANCEEIMQVAGIKTNIYAKICDKITVE